MVLLYVTGESFSTRNRAKLYEKNFSFPNFLRATKYNFYTTLLKGSKRRPRSGVPKIGVHVALGVHLGFSRGTLLCGRMSLFKLNSVSGRNNRLKCPEFSNPVDCNYVKQDN